jgi:hypothetical protein
LKDEERVLVLYLGRNKVRITAGKGTETFEEEAESEAVQWPENNETAVRMAFSPEVLATVARVIQGQKVSIAVDARQILAFFTSEQDDFKAMYVLARYADAKPAAVSVPKAA